MQSHRDFFLLSYIGLVILLLFAAVSSASAANHCVILQYHHFGIDTPRLTSVTPNEFDDHLEYLEEQQYKILPLKEVVDNLRLKKPLPDRCVAITVDDAYISVYDEAFPRLQRRGWPLTVFVSSEQVDQDSRFYMTWEQMREMTEANVAFENHGHSHSHLIRRREGEGEDIWRLRVEKDIDTAQQRIESELGQTPQFFAYPYGEYNDELKEIVRRVGLTAFGQQSGPVWTGSDFLALPRFPIAADYASLSDFKTKVATLPLPVIEAKPEDPLLAIGEWQPKLTVRLAKGNYRKDQLQCYVSGQGAGDLTWEDKNNHIFQVRAMKPLQVGRNRYNCTAPDLQGEHYYWYSHLWIRRHWDGKWYDE
jgi:biofilm PGA synthesis lipoprotein PgaB